jgi:hypothetical protein
VKELDKLMQEENTMLLSSIDDPALTMKVAELADRVEQYQIQALIFKLEECEKKTKDLAKLLGDAKTKKVSAYSIRCLVYLIK